MKYIETRILTSARLRNICIKQNWYTRGDNEQYAALFGKIHDGDGNLLHMTTEKLVDIATDIYEHSEITDYTVESVMAALAQQCMYFFDEEMEVE